MEDELQGSCIRDQWSFIGIDAFIRSALDPYLIVLPLFPPLFLSMPPPPQSEGITSLFNSAYAAFQRIAVGAELVTEDLRQHGDFRQKLGRFWRLAGQAANRAIESVYVLMRATAGTNGGSTAQNPAGPVVFRSVVPQRIRCLSQESSRDVRDWLILRDSMVMANFYRGLFVRLQRLLSRRAPSTAVASSASAQSAASSSSSSSGSGHRRRRRRRRRRRSSSRDR